MDWPQSTSGSAPHSASIAIIATRTRHVTHRAGLDVEMYGMGVAVSGHNDSGFPDILVCVSQNRLFRNSSKHIHGCHRQSGLGNRLGFSTSACGSITVATAYRPLRLQLREVVTPKRYILCSLDGKHKSTARLKHTAAKLAGSFTIVATALFQDVTAESGIFDTSSKSLGVAIARLRSRRLARSSGSQ